MKETFGQRLSRLRKEKGYTQEDIASRITISPQAVSKWENDISSPDILVLNSLADILGVSVDELLGRETPKEKVEAEVVDDDKTIKEEDIHISDKGVHIRDDEGNRVDINDEGIHLVDEEGHKVHITSSGKVCCDKECRYHEHKYEWIVWSIVGGLVLVAYILLGLLWKDQNMGWKMGWLLFLLVPIAGSVFMVIRKRRICTFAYPLAVVMAYCTLGFLGNYLSFEGWSFYWFLFLTIPAFYLIFGPIDKYILHKNDKDSDEDDD